MVELFQEEGVEGAKKVILQILSEKGFARWSDFERVLPKATVSRALRELEREGLVTKRDRYYVLVTKSYDVLIKVEYAPVLCELIPGCADSNRLADDIVKEIGDGILKIEASYSKFINDSLPSLVEAGIVSSIYSLMLKTLYQNKGLFLVVFMEVAKLPMLKRLIDGGCNEILESLPKEYADFLKNVAEKNIKSISKLLGIDIEEMLDTLMKLREILTRHGYRDVIRTKVFLNFEVTIEIRELTMMVLVLILNWFGKRYPENIAKCVTTLFEISDNLIKSGCRPLGKKEKDNLVNNCRDVLASIQV